MPPSVSPSGTARESLGDRALESVTASANTQIWAVKSLGELPGPRAEWAPPKRRARRFNAELTLQGSVHLDPVTHGEVVSEHLNPQRMRQAGLPFEVETSDSMTLDELKAAAMVSLYGPLSPGAETERWRRVAVVTDPASDSDVSDAEHDFEEEDDTVPVFEWVGVADLRIEHVRHEWDEFVPASGEERDVVGDNEKWAQIASRNPEPSAVARLDVLRKLGTRTKMLLNQEAFDVMDSSAKKSTQSTLESTARQLWEMSCDSRILGQATGFQPESFAAIVGFLEAPGTIVTPTARRNACAAAWSLAVSTSGRSGLLSSKGFGECNEDEDGGDGVAIVRALRKLVASANAAVAKLESAAITETKNKAAENAKNAVAFVELENESLGSDTGIHAEALPDETVAPGEGTEHAAVTDTGDAPAVAETDADAVDETQAPTSETPALMPTPEGTKEPPGTQEKDVTPEPQMSSEESDTIALFTHAMNTIGVFAVDHRFRAAYARADPTFTTLIDACGGSVMNQTLSHLRATAARTLASALIRDPGCRKRAVRSGGFGAMLLLTAETRNPEVKLAASTTCACFAREPNVVAKLQTLDADLQTNARAMAGCLAVSLERSSPRTHHEKKRDRDTARAVSASMAGMIRAAVRRASRAGKKAATVHDQKPAFANTTTTTTPIPTATLSQMVAHAHALSVSSRVLVGEMQVAASFGVLAAIAEDRTTCERAVRLGDRPQTPPPFTETEMETHQREAFQARKEGREFVAPVRVKAIWDPKLSVLETCAKTLCKGSSKGNRVGDKTKTPGPEDGCARVAAAVVLARVLEHTKTDDDAAAADGETQNLRETEHALRGAHRRFLASHGNVMSSLLTSLERGACHPIWRVSLAETTSAALMYLCTPSSESCPRSLDDIKRLARLAVRPVTPRDDGSDSSDGADADVSVTQTGVSSSFLAAAVWAIARSPAGRDSLLAASPDLIARFVAAGSALVPSAAARVAKDRFPEGGEGRAEGQGEGHAESTETTTEPHESSTETTTTEPRESSTPTTHEQHESATETTHELSSRVTALEFIVATVWLLSYGNTDSVRGRGEVHGEHETGSCFWTGSSSNESLGVEDQTLSSLTVALAKAWDKVTEMKKIEQAGDVPPITRKAAEALATLAENAVAAAREAARESAGTRAEFARTKRVAILRFLKNVVALPASALTAKARIAAIGAGWNACCLSPEARRESLELGFFDALERCAMDGGAAATTPVVLAAYNAMESLLGSFDDVAHHVGGPKRLTAVATQLASSCDLRERQRGARGLAFITSSLFAHREDAVFVKTLLLGNGAAKLLLSMLCPATDDDDDDDDDGEPTGPMDTGADGDSDSETRGGEHGEFASFGSAAQKTDLVPRPKKQQSRNEILRATEMFAAAALRNLSVVPGGQLTLAKQGLYTLLKTNASAELSARKMSSIGGGFVTGGDLIGGCIRNVASHPKNRTRMYKLELRAKAMERVLHGEAEENTHTSTRHVGGKAAVAARLVGGAHERASSLGTTFEKLTARRRRQTAFLGGRDTRTDENGVVGRSPAFVVPPCRSAAGVKGNGASDSLSHGNHASGPTPADHHGHGSESDADWSDSSHETVCETSTENLVSSKVSSKRTHDLQTTPPTEQTDDDWLSQMMTRHAATELTLPATSGTASKRNATNDVAFNHGLALLAHSMRAPLRHVWARPEITADVDVVGNPNWIANRGATRISMIGPPQRGGLETKVSHLTDSFAKLDTNGKSGFHGSSPGNDSVCEVSIGAATTPARPTSLRSLFLETLPETGDVLKHASLLFFPQQYNPAPEVCALPVDGHTLHVVDPKDTTRRGAFGDVAPRAVRLVVTEVLCRRSEEEHLAVLALKNAAVETEERKKNGLGGAKLRKGVSWHAEPGDVVAEESGKDAGDRSSTEVREQFDPRRHGVFSSRRTESDAKDVFDRSSVYDLMFDSDWSEWVLGGGGVVANNARSTAVGQQSVNTNEFKPTGAKFLKVRLQRIRQAAIDAGSAPVNDEKDALAETRATLRAYYEETVSAFSWFAVVLEPAADDSSGTFRMTRSAFEVFANTCVFAQPRSKCTKAHVAAFFDATAGPEHSAALSRAQFLELLTRLADAKYVKSGLVLSLAEAIAMLFENDILPNVSGDVLADPEAFRERLYAEDVDAVFRGDAKENLLGDEERSRKFDEHGRRVHASSPSTKRWQSLCVLFQTYKDAQDTDRMRLAGWLQMLKKCGIPKRVFRVSESGFGLEDAKSAFARSQSRVVRFHAPANDSINFTDFLEALARVADRFREIGEETDEESDDEEEDGDTETDEDAKEDTASSRAPKKQTDVPVALHGEGVGDPDAPDEFDLFAQKPLAAKLDLFLEFVFAKQSGETRETKTLSRANGA